MDSLCVCRGCGGNPELSGKGLCVGVWGWGVRGIQSCVSGKGLCVGRVCVWGCGGVGGTQS